MLNGDTERALEVLAQLAPNKIERKTAK